MEKYEITKEQILELENGFTLPKLKEWFPEAFETKLQVGKWYIFNTVDDNTKQVLFITEIKGNEVYFYGVDEYSKWRNSDWYSKSHKWIEATEQEVKTALVNEAVKRGFKKGLFIDKLLPFNMGTDKEGIDKKQLESNDFYLSNDRFFCGNLMLMSHDGQWATIIPTLTKKEAEEKLGVKII